MDSGCRLGWGLVYVWRSSNSERGQGVGRASVYEDFRNRLYSGELKPGQFVTQSELAKLAGVSLGSAREAIQKLAHDALLKVHPQRGIQVTEVTIRFIREAFQFRKMMEIAAIQPFVTDAPHKASELLEATRSVLRAATEDTSQHTLDRALEVDWRLHDEIVLSLNNALVQDTYQINAVRLRLIRSNIKLNATRVAGALTEHIGILEACVAGDAGQASERLAVHLDIAMRRAIEGN